jgi:hypothetical protein
MQVAALFGPDHHELLAAAEHGEKRVRVHLQAKPQRTIGAA